MSLGQHPSDGQPVIFMMVSRLLIVDEPGKMYCRGGSLEDAPETPHVDVEAVLGRAKGSPALGTTASPRSPSWRSLAARWALGRLGEGGKPKSATFIRQSELSSRLTASCHDVAAGRVHVLECLEACHTMHSLWMSCRMLRMAACRSYPCIRRRGRCLGRCRL